MRYADMIKGYIPQGTGSATTFCASGRVFVKHPDGIEEDLPREEMVDLLGFDPAALATKPVDRNEYVQIPPATIDP